jgi:hypothetical protein
MYNLNLPMLPQESLKISVTWTLTQTSEQMLITFDGKYCEEYMAQPMRGDAGVPDGIMNSTAYTRSQILWRTSKLEH